MAGAQSPVGTHADPAIEVGASLQAARIARGMSVLDVAHALKLTARQIEAMESGELDRLPGRAFARGFIRNYARLLGLDGNHLLAKLGNLPSSDAEQLPSLADSVAELPTPVSGSGRLLRALTGGAIALLVLAMVGNHFGWFRQTDPVEAMQPGMPADERLAAAEQGAPVFVPAPVMPAAVPQLEVAQTAAAAEPPAPLQPPAVAAPAAGMVRLEFQFEGESWIEVRDTHGKILVSRQFAAGTQHGVEGEPPFKLVVGNASKVRLSRDGQPVDLLPHTKVTVARLSLP